MNLKVLFFILLSFVSSSHAFFKKEKSMFSSEFKKKKSSGGYIKDKELGVKINKPLAEVEFTAEANGKMIYSVVYNHDKYGRRITEGNNPQRKKYIAVFGCSFVYSEGVANKNTIPSEMNKVQLDYNIYNYGARAASPVYHLLLNRRKNLKEELPEKNGIILFMLFNQHERRIFPKFASGWWSENYPILEKDKNGIYKKMRTFKEESPFKFLLMKNFKGPFFRSILWNKKLNRITENEIEKYIDILRALKNETLENSGAKSFVYVLDHRIRSDIKAKILEVFPNSISVELKNGLSFKSLEIPYDGHFNEKGTRYYAREIMSKLNEKK